MRCLATYINGILKVVLRDTVGGAETPRLYKAKGRLYSNDIECVSAGGRQNKLCRWWGDFVDGLGRWRWSGSTMACAELSAGLANTIENTLGEDADS